MFRRGFSLVELMIVVAIIGVLASIAVPNFQKSQLKAKRAEVPTNLAGIGDAELAYYAAYDTWVAADGNPATSYALSGTANPWNPTMAGWRDLGWEPDGPVRCRYFAYIFGAGTWARTDAYCDIDDDNQSAIVRYYVPRQGTPGYFNDVYPTRF